MRRILLVGALFWTGCAPSPDEIPAASPPGYPRAYVMHDCAPWDGPAIAILLTAHAADSLDAGFPMVRLMIYPRGDVVAGHTYRWPEVPEMAAANRCDSAGACEAASSGEITLSEVRADTAVGRARLLFANGTEIVGGFRAAWLNRRVMCG
jgi:hypothetical protein